MATLLITSSLIPVLYACSSILSFCICFPFWAAAPKGPMTYAFTYAEIFPPPSSYPPFAAKFCQILPDSAKSCQILPNSAKICQFQPISSKFCQFLPNFAQNPVLRPKSQPWGPNPSLISKSQTFGPNLSLEAQNPTLEAQNLASSPKY